MCRKVDISKSFVQGPEFSTGFIPEAKFQYYLQNSDSAENGRKLVFHELTAELRWVGHRISLSGPHFLTQGVEGGQQVGVHLAFQLPRWVVDRVEAVRDGDPTVNIQIELVYSMIDSMNRTVFLRATQNIDLKLSALKWGEWLAKLGHLDFWIVEVSRPRVVGHQAVEERIRKAENHLSDRRFPEAVQDLREAWELFNAILDPAWEKVAELIDKGSSGQKPKHRNKSERIHAIRDELDYWSNIGPHDSKYEVFAEDAYLCYEQTVSMISYLSKWLARAP